MALAALLLQLSALAPAGIAALRHQKSLLNGTDASKFSEAPGGKRLVCIAHANLAVGTDLSLIRDERHAGRPIECAGWPRKGLAERYIGTEALPLDAAWWNGSVADLYMPKRYDFEQALQPAGYAGARRRLRSFMLRLLAGERVEVAVLGGSMTFGSEATASWPKLFQEHMRSLGHDLILHNLAKPSTGSEFAVNTILYTDQKLHRSDLVIIDTSINDDRDWFSDPNQGKDTYDVLVQQLLDLPHSPAVIDLATRHRGKVVPKNAYCSTNLSDFTHWRAEAFQLPIVSFPDAMCRCCGTTGLWFGRQHPNATTHDAVARTLVGAFGVEMERTCMADGLAVKDHPVATQVLQTAPFAQCMRSRPRTSVDFTTLDKEEAGEPFVQGHDGGWRFARDFPTKPFGWLIYRGLEDHGTISLKVNASTGGWVRIDYLATYQNMGLVRCWVDGVTPDPFGCDISGVLVGDHSAVWSAYIGLPSSLDAQLVHCSSIRGKFKILGLASC